MKTELIAAFKFLMVKGIEKVLITTVSGETIWVNKTQFDPSAETITYQVQPIGTPYKDKTGAMVNSTQPFTQLIGFHKQVVKKLSAVELYTELAKVGITPAINVG